MRAAAAKELEDWYKHRDEQLEKTKATNRWVTVTAISDNWELKLLFWVKALAYGYRLDVLVDEPDVSPLAVQGPLADVLMARVFGYDVRAI